MLLKLKTRPLTQPPRAVLYELDNKLGSLRIPEEKRVVPVWTETGKVESEYVEQRLPCTYLKLNDRGDWDARSAYNKYDVVLYDNVLYVLTKGSLRVNRHTPLEDNFWETLQTLDTLFIELPDSTPQDWALRGVPGFPVFGEVAVYEGDVKEPYLKEIIKLEP